MDTNESIPQPQWSDAERLAWRPPEKLKPSEWATRHRVLPASVSAEPGRYRLDRTPYAGGILDAVVEQAVEEIWFVSGTQIGKTTIQENILAYWVDNDPGPCLIVKPSEAAVEESVKERWRPLLEGTPALRQHLSPRPQDNTLTSIKLDSMPIYFGWAGSPQSLASRPCKYVLPDEVDKFPPYAGREADPISLARERTVTYGHRRRLVAVSTPTTREGAIWRGFESCGDRRRYQVPCPHCGEYQQLAWSQVKWPKLEIAGKVERADAIEQGRMAWYECASCKGRIEESHKPKMLKRGVWVSYDRDDKPTQTVDRDGTLRGDRPVSKRVGFHLSSLYSPWKKFWEMAAEFIRADGDPGATMNFRNSWLAEPFETQVSRREPSKIREKRDEAEKLGRAGLPRVVPDWAVLLVATCDVQKDHCYWQVDAWGYELKSKRLAVGVAATLDEVYRQVFHPDVPFTSEQGGPVHASELIVDSGYRKDEVTEFARRDPQRVRMAKGLSTYFGPIAEQKVERASGVLVWNINTKQSKDTLDRLIGDPDQARWQAHAGISDEFCAQLASEHKIIDPQTKQEVWKKKTEGAANHWWDCSAMSCAVASAMGAAMPKPPEPAPPPPRREDPERSWMPDRPSSWMNR